MSLGVLTKIQNFKRSPFKQMQINWTCGTAFILTLLGLIVASQACSELHIKPPSYTIKFQLSCSNVGLIKFVYLSPIQNKCSQCFYVKVFFLKFYISVFSKQSTELFFHTLPNTPIDKNISVENDLQMGLHSTTKEN